MSQSDLPNFLLVAEGQNRKEREERKRGENRGWEEKKFIASRQRARATAGKSRKLLPHAAVARDSLRYDEKRSFLSEKEARMQLPRAARQMSKGYEEHERRQKFASNQESFDSIIPSIGKYRVTRSIRREKRLIRDCQARFSRRNLIRL